MGDRRANHIGV